MRSPGAPSLRHEIERQFWKQIATGHYSADIAAITFTHSAVAIAKPLRNLCISVHPVKVTLQNPLARGFSSRKSTSYTQRTAKKVGYADLP